MTSPRDMLHGGVSRSGVCAEMGLTASGNSSLLVARLNQCHQCPSLWLAKLVATCSSGVNSSKFEYSNSNCGGGGEDTGRNEDSDNPEEPAILKAATDRNANDGRAPQQLVLWGR